MFYSPTTGGFYSHSVHGNDISADAAEISTAEHLALLNAEAHGKIIQPDADGRPVAVDPPAPPEPTQEELAADVRAERDARLRACDPQALPDYPHESDASRQAWLAYRQALRDLPSLSGFPWGGPQDPEASWPEEP